MPGKCQDRTTVVELMHPSALESELCQKNVTPFSKRSFFMLLLPHASLPQPIDNVIELTPKLRVS
jgi:hypothetical protein